MSVFLASRDNQGWSGVSSWIDKFLGSSFPSPPDGALDAYEAHSPPLTGTPFAGFATILCWSYSPVRSLRLESTRVPELQMWLLGTDAKENVPKWLFPPPAVVQCWYLLNPPPLGTALKRKRG